MRSYIIVHYLLPVRSQRIKIYKTYLKKYYNQDGSRQGTPIPLGFTTTIRPAGRTTAGGGLLSGRNLKTFHQRPEDETEDSLEDDDMDQAPTESSQPVR